MDSLENFDAVFSEEDGSSIGYVLAWGQPDRSPWLLQVEEQTLPSSIVRELEDENYGFRDLQDAWRVSFTNFIGGEGQHKRDVTNGVSAKYYRSQLIDNSIAGELRLHHDLHLRTDPASSNKVSDRIGTIAIEWKGKIAFSCTPFNTTASCNHRQVGIFDPQAASTTAWSWLGKNSDPGTSAATVSALATDGDKLYVAYSGGDLTADQGIWSYTSADIDDETPNTETQLANDADSKLVTRMAFSAGYLYLATAHKVGYLKGTTFESLYPDSIIEPTMTTFGLVSMSAKVYWGVAGGMRSWVYEVQWDGTDAIFLQHVEMPTGFVGSALISYLSQLFICGYYISNTAGISQGVVYLSTDSGLARLCVIGDDPNEVEIPLDEYKNQILAGYGYDHFLYLLTPRSFYRWNLQSGGLNHIAEAGTFAVSSGSPGHIVTTPWQTAEGYYTGYAHGLCGSATPFWPHLSAEEAGSESFHLLASNTVVGDNFTTFYSDTGNHQGNLCYKVYSSTSTTYGNYANGGTIEVRAKEFDKDCLELQICTATKKALVSFYGAQNDLINVYFLNSSGVRTLAGQFKGHVAYHTLQLTCDPATNTARLWKDGILFKKWTLRTGTFTAGIAYTLGSHLLPATSPSLLDWRFRLASIRWAAGAGYDPGWFLATGVVGAGSFPVVSNTPWLPALEGTTKGLISFSGPSGFTYPSYAAEESEGWLETSESAAKMPTVEKFLTFLDVYHEPVLAGQEIIIIPFLDGIQMPSLSIGETDLVTRNSHLALYGATGSTMKLVIVLRSGSDNTPIFHGASLRFSPLDNSYYQLRFDLRQVRRDNTGASFDTQAALSYLLRIADNKQVVLLTTALESSYVRVSLLQIEGAQPNPDDQFEPQGFATVRLKRVQ